MNANPSVSRPDEKPEVTRGVVRRMVQVVTTMLLLVAILFVSAGSLRWIWGWIYLAVYAFSLAINSLVLLPHHRELVAERGRIKADAKTWDRVLGIFILIPTLGMLVVAGLDQRFGWSPPLALAIHLIALCIGALASALFAWALVSNAFFSRAVRIQLDRDHAVASGGPYRYVRHPGYVAMIVTVFAASLLLGSLWALIPAGLVACAYVVRTALEDRTLLEELDGYRDYAAQTRYRLLPGVW
jgi:protein-S-isoprenylcysteine O-methyltransferase Ste14